MKKIYSHACRPFRPASLNLGGALALASVVLASVLTPSASAAPREVAFMQDMTTLRAFSRSNGLDVSGDRAQLTRSFLIQDEVGNTDYKNLQPLSASMWARKILVLPYAADSNLLVFGPSTSPQPQPGKITVNGHIMPPLKPVPSTGWLQVSIPAAWLRGGANEIVFSGGGQLLIENSLLPNRSARSVDGGRTWQDDELGPDGIHNGEYLVRLRPKAYAPQATLTSDVIDLLDPEGKRPLRPSATISAVQLQPVAASGKGLAVQARSGTTPVYEPESWTSWTDVAAGGSVAQRPATGRYVQWRANLRSGTAQSTPSFTGVRITAQVDEQALPAGVKVMAMQSYPVTVGSYRFAFQPQTSGRLKILRERYKLDQVIAPGKTELEQLVLLRNWVRHQWQNGWVHNELSYVPPWDALLILDMAPREKALGMCTHYSTVFVQCALALGWTARHLILEHHCAAEVWSDQLGKWLVMDAGNSQNPELNSHFERDGIPLNALEIRNLWKQNAVDKIQVVYSPPHAPVAGDKMPPASEQVQFSNYSRLAIPFRNNHLDTPFPGELEHGEAQFFHDGYLWWQDGAVPTTYPEYSHLTYRPQDMYWNLNQVALDLIARPAAEQNALKLQVGLATHTPNFSHYLTRTDEGAWQRQDSPTVEWPLHPGSNRLEVKVVNKFGREGKPSYAVIEVNQ